MNTAEAIDFLRPAVRPRHGKWADLGAGDGTFTRVLAQLLDATSLILAVDADPTKVAALERLAEHARPHGRIVALHGDLARADEIPELERLEPDGVLLSNVLHYFRDPTLPLRSVGRILGDGGRIVIVEYDREAGNRWVPYPIPRATLTDVAAEAGLRPPEIVSSRPSFYQGDMYCAVTFLHETE